MVALLIILYCQVRNHKDIIITTFIGKLTIVQETAPPNQSRTTLALLSPLH